MSNISQVDVRRPGKGLYSVYDRVSGGFSPPFVASSVGEAIRTVSHNLNTSKPDSLHVQHAADFQLFLVSGWNDVRGVENVPERPEFIKNFLELLKSNETKVV